MSSMAPMSPACDPGRRARCGSTGRRSSWSADTLRDGRTVDAVVVGGYDGERSFTSRRREWASLRQAGSV
jgi:hypothetical protein